MKKLIEIPEPCNADWSSMVSLDERSRYCKLCTKPVHDFTKDTIEDIAIFFARPENSGACGKYSKRHTLQASKLERSVTLIEQFFLKHKLKQVAVFLVGLTLFFSSCRRHVQGRMKAYTSLDTKHPNKTQNLTGAKR